MNRLFVYATLKAKAIQDKVLGHDAKVEAQATVHDFKEINVRYNAQMWPTLVPLPGARTPGEILSVTGDDLAKLDKWESNYSRQSILTDKGIAWTYLFRKTK
jgi:gamma-glutamylcyclotransferase (GGCT)/AIG2-like uncharacterized protein YtfP